jgi:hypothetical protein
MSHKISHKMPRDTNHKGRVIAINHHLFLPQPKFQNRQLRSLANPTISHLLVLSVEAQMGHSAPTYTHKSIVSIVDKWVLLATC